MKQIKLYSRDNFKDWETKWEDVKPFKIVSVSDDIELWDRAIKINDTYYRICVQQGNNYQVKEILNFNLNKSDTWGEQEIKCPICGYEMSDSWEYEDDEGEEICGGCGATLEWKRDVEVTYSTEVKERVEPIILGEE